MNIDQYINRKASLPLHFNNPWLDLSFCRAFGWICSHPRQWTQARFVATPANSSHGIKLDAKPFVAKIFIFKESQIYALMFYINDYTHRITSSQLSVQIEARFTTIEIYINQKTYYKLLPSRNNLQVQYLKVQSTYRNQNRFRSWFMT